MNNQQVINDARKDLINKCLTSLAHALKCNQDCKEESCTKMKRVVLHPKDCELKTEGGCVICKELVSLCSYHAKFCCVSQCDLCFCTEVKAKFEIFRGFL